MLYFIQNKIGHIDGLEAIAQTLESVEFGGNKLRVSIEETVQVTIPQTGP